MMITFFLLIFSMINDTKSDLILSQKSPLLTINESSIICVEPQLIKLSKLWSFAKVSAYSNKIKFFFIYDLLFLSKAGTI